MRVQVIGAGSWGLALARRLALNGHAVRLWCREEDGPDQLRDTRSSPYYLPGVLLPETVEVHRDVDPDAEMAVLAVPSHAMRAVTEAREAAEATCGLNDLTPRELEVLGLLARGYTNKEIAAELVITTNTVKRHLKAIFGKLEVHTRSGAAAKAVRAGLAAAGPDGMTP